MKAAQFTNNTQDSDWENLAQHRTITSLYAPFKAYSGECAWKAVCDRLRKPHYLSKVGHVHLESKKQSIMLGGSCVYSRM